MSDQLLYLEDKVHIIRRGMNFNSYEVVTLDELANIRIDPPAMAYVRSTGCYYFKFPTNPYLAVTSYTSLIGDGWQPVDISSPQYDRPIHIVNTRWVQTPHLIQDLDYYPGYIHEGGDYYPAEIIEGMPEPSDPETEITELLNITPGDLVLRINENPDLYEWYIASVEVLNLRRSDRYCWDLMRIAVGNIPARFERVIHAVDSEEAFDGLFDRNKVVPGDMVMHKTNKTWGYMVPDIDSILRQVFCARELVVKDMDDFNSIHEDFTFGELFVINLKHSSQYWLRELPNSVDKHGNIGYISWEHPQHPGEFCYINDN